MRLLKGGPIRVGDKTTGGGGVTGPGEPNDIILGKPLVTKGMQAICCGGIQTFVEGCIGEHVEGRGWVLEGHKLSCGHYAISSCAQFFWVEDTIPAGQPGEAEDEPNPPAALASKAQAPEEDHWLDLRLTDKGEPLPNQRYVVTDPAGRVHEGTLDANAYARVSPVKRGPCRVDFPDLGYSTVVVV